MKFDSKQIVEVVSTFTIVASLIFVGFQLLLDRRVAMSEQYQGRAAITIDYQRSLFENDTYIATRAKLWEEDRPSWWTDDIETMLEELTMEEIVRETYLRRMEIYSIDNLYFQYLQDMYTESAWSSALNNLERQLRNPLWYANYTALRGISPELKQLIDELSQ